MTLVRRTPLRRKGPLKTWTRINPRRSKPRRGPARSPTFLAWVRRQPCCAPGAPATCEGQTHAHHAGQVRGAGMKPADDTAIPLCRKHHLDEWHGYAGIFAGWSREMRASWAATMIAKTQAAFAAR